MGDRDLDDRLAAMAALGDPVRRELYGFVAGQDHPVSRDEAAQAAGVPRSTAAFHLDRLVAEGLLETEFRRLSGRQGPGAGRPSKLYRRAAREIAVTLPPRHYDLAADLLASAVTEAARTGASADATLRQVAKQRGAALAADRPIHSQGRRPSRHAEVGAATAVLAEHGYEPRVGEEEIVLANCPFHALVGKHAELVCRMNLSLLEGFAEALPDGAMQARPQPSVDHCCVRLDLKAPTRRRN